MKFVMNTTETVGPLVSICVPTYNDGPFLFQTLESIVNQTYPRLEILIGNDGSTDDTEEIVRSFNEPRIRYYLNETNLGQFENVNSLIKRAQGQYIAIYHSDDIYESQIVEKEVSFLETHPEAGAVFALDRWIDAEGNIFGETELPQGIPPNTCLALDDAVRILLCEKNCLIRTPTFMGRAKVFERLGFFSSNYDIAGDLEMWLRILTVFKIGIVGEHLMRYRCDATQVSSIYNYLRTFEEHFFPLMDLYLTKCSLTTRIDSSFMTEYAFHRCDDQTFRAINWLLKGNPIQAAELLRQGFPWCALLRKPTFRKIRVVVLRTLVRLCVQLYPDQRLNHVLHYIAYRKRFIPCQLQAP
jgi:GT2 family glycosyltransferase